MKKTLDDAQDEFEEIQALSMIIDCCYSFSYARNVLIREALRNGFPYRRLAFLAGISKSTINRALHHRLKDTVEGRKKNSGGGIK